MNEDQRRAYTQYVLDDAANRIRWQHEFSLAGIRTLVLINGGAVIALLTYIGNDSGHDPTKQLGAAFFWYISGLVFTVVAYLISYLSQGVALGASFADVQMAMDMAEDPKAVAEEREQFAERTRKVIWVGIAMTLAALFSFVAGSWCAMHALT